MSHRDDNKQLAQLQRVNEELTESLERCRSLLSECRSKLAANGNDEDDSGSEREEARLG